MKVLIPGFVDLMPRRQKIAGFVYLPLHVFVLPLLLAMLAYYIPGGMGELPINIIYYSMGLVFCLTVMWHYLRSSFDVLLDNLARSIISLFTAYFIYWLFSAVAGVGLLWLLGDELLNPNNNAVAELTSKSPGPMIGLAVFIGPIVEEVLFRGVLFGSLRHRSRFLAYAISMGVFALYHVWQFALTAIDWKMLLYAIQYLPVGYALGWLYERTSSIWTCIAMHMLVNIISMLVLV